MSDLLERKRRINMLEAYQFSAHVGDLRLGAIWPMWHEEAKHNTPIPACLHLHKEFFPEIGEH